MLNTTDKIFIKGPTSTSKTIRESVFGLIIVAKNFGDFSGVLATTEVHILAASRKDKYFLEKQTFSNNFIQYFW